MIVLELCGLLISCCGLGVAGCGFVQSRLYLSGNKIYKWKKNNFSRVC